MIPAITGRTPCAAMRRPTSCRCSPPTASAARRPPTAGATPSTAAPSSPITHGEKVAEMSRTEEGLRLASFDLDEIAELRRTWGVFRDRRPELYGTLLHHRRPHPPRRVVSSTIRSLLPRAGEGSSVHDPSPARGRRWRAAPDEGRCVSTGGWHPRSRSGPHPPFGHPLPSAMGEGRGSLSFLSCLPSPASPFSPPPRLREKAAEGRMRAGAQRRWLPPRLSLGPSPALRDDPCTTLLRLQEKVAEGRMRAGAQRRWLSPTLSLGPTPAVRDDPCTTLLPPAGEGGRRPDEGRRAAPVAAAERARCHRCFCAKQLPQRNLWDLPQGRRP